MTAKRPAATRWTREADRSLLARLPTNAAMAATDQRAAVAPDEDRDGRGVARRQRARGQLRQVAPLGDEHDPEDRPRRRPEAPHLRLVGGLAVRVLPAHPHDDRGDQEDEARDDVNGARRQERQELTRCDGDQALHRERRGRSEEHRHRPVARGEHQRGQGGLVGKLRDEDDAVDRQDQLEKRRHSPGDVALPEAGVEVPAPRRRYSRRTRLACTDIRSGLATTATRRVSLGRRRGVGPTRDRQAGFPAYGLSDRTVVATAFAASPLRLLTPGNHGDAAWVFLASLGGGLLDGDRIDIDVDVGEGASALLGTQASTKVYRSAGSATGSLGSSQRLSARVAAGARLDGRPRSGRLLRGRALRAGHRDRARPRRLALAHRRLLLRSQRARRAVGVLAVRVAHHDRPRRARDRSSTPLASIPRHGPLAASHGPLRRRPVAPGRGAALRRRSRGDARALVIAGGARGAGGRRSGAPARGDSVLVAVSPLGKRRLHSSRGRGTFRVRVAHFAFEFRGARGCPRRRPLRSKVVTVGARCVSGRRWRCTSRLAISTSSFCTGQGWSRRSAWRAGCASTTRRPSRSSRRRSSSSFATGARSPS